MENKAIVKKYFNKYWKEQYFKESDQEFKDLVKILNDKDKQVKNLILPVVVKQSEQLICDACGYESWNNAGDFCNNEACEEYVSK